VPTGAPRVGRRGAAGEFPITGRMRKCAPSNALLRQSGDEPVIVAGRRVGKTGWRCMCAPDPEAFETGPVRDCAGGGGPADPANVSPLSA